MFFSDVVVVAVLVCYRNSEGDWQNHNALIN